MSYLKVFTLILIFAGELFAIYAEMIGAKMHAISSQNFSQVFLKMLPIMIIAGALLITGYIFGYRAFKNIWIVSAVSITSILIIEPILAWVVFQQVPTTGALIGFILGAIGLFASLYF
ncbi:MAG: hypothetical protein U1A25_03430 [Candidatus Sungbacteria bacterium]|nr:hypothetical protein [bacterium]MDZ4260696.1 hypothetical protein [Candidatus Sungbacteria bacterium]